MYPMYTYVGQALSKVEIPAKSQIVSPQKYVLIEKRMMIINKFTVLARKASLL